MASKKITTQTQSLIYILIIIGFVVVFNYLANKKFFRLDLTENKMYSISDASKRLLKDLDDIVSIKVYFSKNLPPHLKKLEADVRDLLGEFKAYAGKNLHIAWEDPSENEETKQKVRSLGIPEVQLQTFEKDKAQVINGFLGLAILYEDKKEVIEIIQNVNNFEYDLAQKIMKVFRTETPKVGVLKVDTTPYFDEMMRMQMRGQLPPDPTEEKFQPIYQNLRENYTVQTVDISDGKEIDPSIKTLIIPGGDDKTFTDRDLFAIDQYFMKGGNLIVLADAVNVDLSQGAYASTQNPGILKLLEHYGVRVEKKLVLDASCGQVQVPQQFGMFQMNVMVNYPYVVKITPDGFNENNPAVTGLGQMIFPWVSPLKLLVDENSTDSNAVKATVLVKSSNQSWESNSPFNLHPQQNWGSIIQSKKNELKEHTLVAYLNGNFSSYFKGKPIPAAEKEDSDDPMSQIKVENKDNNSETIVESNTNRHLIVAGDADFLTPQNAAPGNVAWVLNVVDWLTLDDNLIKIRSRTLIDRTIKNDRLVESKSYASTIRLINILLMPLLVIVFGLIIFLKRREVVQTGPSTQNPVTKNNSEGTNS